ncbi:MAG: leucine-rich repeat domain-containing protein, partial [Lachnospiraceae bacterium]|nr:leucine-rich repeat domain-containing protein [Lachnospiraceae bacterium]
NRKITKTLGVLLLLTAIAVAQVPVSDVEASTTASDFEMDGNKLLRYTGTAEVVSIPAGVKSIGEEAFAGNDNLVKVTIEGDVESIDYRAFAECDNLRTVSIGNSVEKIETAAFSNNKELVNVSVGTGLKDLGSGVFAGCSQLKSLSLSEANPYLCYENGILYDDDKSTVYMMMPMYEKEAVILPNSVTEIKAYSFWGNPYVRYAYLGSGLYEVPEYAFSNCMNLNDVEIPLPVRGIGAKAFEDCVNLASVIVPESVTRISDSAFDGCPKVVIDAVPGTYAAEFGAALQKSEVDEIEYEDVQDSQVIPTDENGINLDDWVQDGESPVIKPEEEVSPGSDVETVTETVTNQRLLGQSSIVTGRAVVFIDNRVPEVFTGDARIDLSQPGLTQSGNTGADTQREQIGDLLTDNAEKGKDFPKYTVVNGKIASQAYYQDSSLNTYEIAEDITEIGEFAFARSALTEIKIPEGVTKIGYGAFYHCDDLKDVTIPDSVTEIEPYAFDKTAWVENNVSASNPYLIVGDGILIAYGGSDSVVNIPAGVKQIGACVFKDHMGITAVNLPDSVEVIGEEAFMNCRNLTTVNGGNNLIKVKDRAFMNCPLSGVTIPASMKEIGLGAYAISDGTDTVVFKGSELPSLTIDERAKRLANDEYRTYTFGDITTAIVQGSVSELEGTVLEPGTYGFAGKVVNEGGMQLSDNQSGVTSASYDGVTMQINSDSILEGANMTATIPGEEGNFVLRIQDSGKAAEEIAKAYGDIYGGKYPTGLKAYDVSLYDETGTIPITRLGKQSMTVQVPMPSGTSESGLHVVTLDHDGQLEALEYRIVEMEDGKYLQFTTNHFSPVGVYKYSSYGGQAVVSNGNAVILGTGAKDDTPDTGDLIHPKWFFVVGLTAAAVALLLYKGKRKVK